jgi:hypothetical protein
MEMPCCIVHSADGKMFVSCLRRTGEFLEMGGINNYSYVKKRGYV